MSCLAKLHANLTRKSTKDFLLASTTRYMSTTTPAIDTVGIIGLGLMGHGICQVTAASNNHSSIIAYESDEQFLLKGKSRIEKSIAKLLSRGKLTQEDADRTIQSITYTTDMAALSNVDLVVEAVIENMDLKKDIYQKLSRICQKETIFASNTSSLSITEMADYTDRPDRFIGVHFFNPVQMMKLVELIHTKYTAPHVLEQAYDWATGTGKTVVKCGDTPGFIVNRLLVPSLMQAMFMVDRCDASVKDIDLSLQLGAGHPMGPLCLADYIGLDTCYFIVKGWTEKFPDEPAFAIPKCLEDKVNAGDLGRKSGKGFYHWNGDKRGDPIQ